MTYEEYILLVRVVYIIPNYVPDSGDQLYRWRVSILRGFGPTEPEEGLAWVAVQADGDDP